MDLHSIIESHCISFMKEDGLSYEDEYLGNALAGIIKIHLMEIRVHRDFTEERVTQIVKKLRKLEGLDGIFSIRTEYDLPHLFSRASNALFISGTSHSSGVNGRAAASRM